MSYTAITHTILSQPTLDVRRLDLIDPNVSGNKFFKLKYNLIQAKQQGYTGILSFGGAFSNHLYALSFACRHYQLDNVAIVRGDELAHRPLNSMLQVVQQNGTLLKFVSREVYRKRHESDMIHELSQNYPNYYILPEGGTNELAIQGCSEILTDDDLAYYDAVCCAVGTGGTLRGLIQRTAHLSHLKIYGFSALKDPYISQQIATSVSSHSQHWHLFYDYCLGGYAKYSPELMQFIQQFQARHHIPLEPIYTGKMMYGLFDLIQKGFFSNNHRILAIHSGGLHAFQS